MLIGAIISAVIFASFDRMIAVPRSAFVVAQAVVGLLMAHALHLDYLKEIASQWPIFVVGVFSVIVLSYIIGYVLARLQVLPGSTALWGASPGSASTMVLLCEAFNADQRLVAFMAYMRVILVACLTTTVGHHYMTGHTPPVWLTMQSPGSLVQTLIVLVIAIVVGGRLRLPSAPMLLSLFIAIIAQTYTGKTADLPLWLLAPSYLALGWVIGGRFTRKAVHHAWRALPAVITANLILIVGCALIAWPIAKLMHTSYLAAYLATSPGGSDSVAIIAMALPVDRGFVMAMQIFRLFAVLAIAPPLAMGLARLLPPELSEKPEKRA